MDRMNYSRPPLPIPRPLDNTPTPPRQRGSFDPDNAAKFVKVLRVVNAYVFSIGFMTVMSIVVAFLKALSIVSRAEMGMLNLFLVVFFFTEEVVINFVQYPYFLILMSVAMVTYVHGAHSEIAVRMPTKRYQLILEILKLRTVCHMVVMGLGCTLFVQSSAAILNIPLTIRVDCDEIDDLSTPETEHVCINQKNVFILFAVLIATMWQFVTKKCSKEYRMQFFYVERRMSEHMKWYVTNNWKQPFRQTLTLFPVVFLLYRFTFVYLLYIWQIFSSVKYTMNTWEDIFDISFIAKILIWCCVGLSLFMYEWVCVNYCLVKKPDFSIQLNAPGSRSMQLKYCFTCKEPFLQAVGFYDLMMICQAKGAKLRNLFALSHPGNKPDNWNHTLNACILRAKEIQESYAAFIAKCTTKPNKTNAKSDAQPNPNVRTGVGLTIYNAEPHHIPDAPDSNIRSRSRLFARNLSTNNWPQTTARNSINVTPAKKLVAGSANLISETRDTTLAVFGTIEQIIKNQLSWNYWMITDPKLEVANLMADSFLLIWIVSSIVDALCYAVSCEASAVIQQDVVRVNKFLIELYETVAKLGPIIHQIHLDQASTNHEPDNSSVRTDENHTRLQSAIRSSVTKYSLNFRKHFGVLAIPPAMQQSIQKIVDSDI